MRSARCLFAALWLVLLAALAAIAQGGKAFAVVPKTGPLANRTLYTNSHALLVGVSKYADSRVRSLHYADRDATDLRDLLVRSYGFPAENVTLLLNEQATLANIRSALNKFADGERVKAGDRVLIFFSGHGQTVSLPGSGEMGFLIPYDAKVDLAHPENRSGYFESCVDMETVWRTLRGCAAKHALVLADACYGGQLTQSRAPGLPLTRPSPEVLASFLARPARQTITAGDKDQEVEERPDLGHGAFTYHLLEELKARAAAPDQPFLAAELAQSLKFAVGNETKGKQNVQDGRYGGSQGEFVFIPLGTDPGGPFKAGQVRVNEKDGAEMVYIPAGAFQMGTDKEQIDAAWKRFGWPEVSKKDAASEAPIHQVQVSGFWLYRTEATVAQFRKFCQASGRQMPDQPEWSKEDHPVVNVSWKDAKAYCDWAGVRLPTEAEWERAARGPYTGLNGQPRRTFAWGDDLPKAGDRVGNLADETLKPSYAYFTGYTDGFKNTASVESFRPSEWNLHDLAGNVWEWCADWYAEDYYEKSPTLDPKGPADGKSRVLRGGGWNSNPVVLRVSRRNRPAPDYRDVGVGFRPAQSL